jgi:NAD-dependent dihydropyrimidine dehydrogenase PreA subunit
LGSMPQIITEKCNGCGLCVSVCQCNAFTMVNNIVTVTEVENCFYCTLCEAVCPTGAIICPFEIIFEEDL